MPRTEYAEHGQLVVETWVKRFLLRLTDDPEAVSSQRWESSPGLSSLTGALETRAISRDIVVFSQTWQYFGRQVLYALPADPVHGIL